MRPRPATLDAARRQVETRARALEAQIQRWLNAVALIEYRRAAQDPLAYVKKRRVIAKERIAKDDHSEHDQYVRLKGSLREILLRFGMREAGDAAGRVAGREVIPESLIRQATENKPVKIKWFWELQNGIIQRVEDITDATREAARASVKRIILESLEDTNERGERAQPSVGEIARRIRTAFTGPEVERDQRVHATENGRSFVFSSARAELIARTELAQAQNTGIVAGYAATGIKQIEWIAYSDGKSGDRHHERLDGERVKLGEYFETPLGNRLRYPGDPSAPIRETANCRCTSRAVIEEAEA